MDLTSEFLKGLLDLRRDTVVQVDGLNYFTKPDGGATLVKPPRPAGIAVTTLTGFVDAVKANVDEFGKQKVIAHIEDYKTVRLQSRDTDVYGDRQTFVSAQHPDRGTFPFGAYLDPETFLIRLQACFDLSENVDRLIALVSALSYANTVRTEDDGITQAVTINKGAVSRAGVSVTPRWPLAARRTFLEADQPVVPFLIRMKGEDGKLPQIALYEVDGGAWQGMAMQNIRKYLTDELESGFVILA